MTNVSLRGLSDFNGYCTEQSSWSFNTIFTAINAVLLTGTLFYQYFLYKASKSAPPKKPKLSYQNPADTPKILNIIKRLIENGKSLQADNTTGAMKRFQQAKTIIGKLSKSLELLEGSESHKEALSLHARSLQILLSPKPTAKPEMEAATIKRLQPSRSFTTTKVSEHTTGIRAYADFPCSEQFRNWTKELLEMLVRDSSTELLGKLKKRANLFDLARQLHGKKVHPLKFIEMIYLDPEIKPLMSKVFENKEKRNEIMSPSGSIKAIAKVVFPKLEVQGLKEQLDLRVRLNKLEPYIDDFCQAIGVHRQEIQHFFLESNWEGLISHLLNR